MELHFIPPLFVSNLAYAADILPSGRCYDISPSWLNDFNSDVQVSNANLKLAINEYTATSEMHEACSQMSDFVTGFLECKHIMTMGSITVMESDLIVKWKWAVVEVQKIFP